MDGLWLVVVIAVPVLAAGGAIALIRFAMRRTFDRGRGPADREG